MSRNYLDIDINLKLNPITNDVNVKYDDNAIKQSINLLLNTRFYDRAFSPEIGSHFSRFLFDLNDRATLEILEEEVKRLLQDYEPRVELLELYVDTTDQLTDTNHVVFRMRYRIINAKEPREELFTVKRIR